MQKRKKAVNGLKIFIIFHLMCFFEGKKNQEAHGPHRNSSCISFLKNDESHI